MVFLEGVKLLNEQEECELLIEKKIKSKSPYPFRIFPNKGVRLLGFKPVTIFYGGNGTGKSTLLNVIADRIGAERKVHTNRGSIYKEYVSHASFNYFDFPNELKIITSEDIFDYMLDVKAINRKVNPKDSEIVDEYFEMKCENSDDPYLNYKKKKEEALNGGSKLNEYIDEKFGSNQINLKSNGEVAFDFWKKEIKERAIYLIDEPENSLSIISQLRLKKLIVDYSLNHDTQFIIATHSPILLSINDALIYDLDFNPVKTKKWYELENVIMYYKFFKDNEDKFE